MNVRVDVAGQNEFAGAIDSRTPSFGPVEALRFPNSGDTISVDQDYRILNNLAVARIDQRPAGKRDFFSRSAAGEREPELGRAHAERDEQDWESHEKRADVREKFAEERHHAEDERRLHADEPHAGADRKPGHESVDRDAAHPRGHLSREARERA